MATDLIQSMAYKSLCIALLIALTPHLTASAEPTTTPPMAAAGTLIRDGSSDCSAVLIGSDRVLTAAHCVANKTLVEEGGDATILFRTGAYPGHPAVTRKATEIMLHPIYRAGRGLPVHPTGSDIAMLALDEPIPASVAIPLIPGPPVAEGERVLIASYPGGRGQRARERRCPASNSGGTVARLSCPVQPGESGAPVVRLLEDGLELAAIVVARTEATGRPFAILVQVDARLRQLYAIYGTPNP